MPLDQADFRLAADNQGVLKAADLVVHLGLDLKDASDFLEKLTLDAGGSVQMVVRENGVTIYDFLELKPEATYKLRYPTLK
jgi:hypothetical protein